MRARISASRRGASDLLARIAAHFVSADVSLFHSFQPAPAGGGHQFLRALRREFEARGLRVENNRISRTSRACLFNSFNFDFDRLRRFRRSGCRMVHRVDGPISAYRGRDEEVDRGIWELNLELADATIFQSEYSLRGHLEMGLEFKDPVVVMNAPDPHHFHARGRVPFSRARKTRLVSVSWSDNPNKGAAAYRWLGQQLDWDRFEYTFVGRTPLPFDRIRAVAPLPSRGLGELLRRQDIYITASENDPCSNSLLEALACGLPAIYLNSGGHPEIVRDAGLPFSTPEEVPGLLEELVAGYEGYRARIAIPSLSHVADHYLAVMKI